jgi:hypothetical protein
LQSALFIWHFVESFDPELAVFELKEYVVKRAATANNTTIKIIFFMFLSYIKFSKTIYNKTELREF